MQAKKKEAAEAKQKKAEEKKEFKKREAEEAYAREEMNFIFMQQDEQERQQRFKEYQHQEEQATKKAWEGPVVTQVNRAQAATAREEEVSRAHSSTARQTIVEKRKLDDMEAMRLRVDEERYRAWLQKEEQMEQANSQQGTSNKRTLLSPQNTQFKMPRKVSMFDYLRE